jgi:hypothetical protein
VEPSDRPAARQGEPRALRSQAGRSLSEALFRHVDWEPGEVIISLLGIGEKGTTQEGRFKERKIVPPAFIGSLTNI